MPATANATPKKKRPSGKSPTKRSLDLLRGAGWTVAVVEHWNAFARQRQDLYGFGDLAGMFHGRPHTLFQVTTAANLAARRTKILALDAARLWLETGGAIVLHGWSLRGPAGCKKHWGVNEQSVTMADFTERREMEE